MSKPDIYMFHLKRSNGSSLFLHPFNPPEKLLSITSENAAGHFGMDPNVESFSLFRNELYKLTDEAVREWIKEKKFLPRFAGTAFVFLVAYLFFSIVIRDPFPVLDEIILGVLSAWGANRLMRKKENSSKEAVKKRVELKNRIDAIEFSRSEAVLKAEEALAEAEKASDEDFLSLMSVPLYLPGEEKLKADFAVSIKDSFSPAVLKKLRKSARKGEKKYRAEVLLQKSAGRIDLPLLIIYERVSASLKS